MTNLVLANRAKLLRKSNNYTQKQLAKEVGVSQAYISRVETEGLVPPWYILYTLADALHTTTDYLLPEQPEDPKDLEIFTLQEKLEARITALEEIVAALEKRIKS